MRIMGFFRKREVSMVIRNEMTNAPIIPDCITYCTATLDAPGKAAPMSESITEAMVLIWQTSATARIANFRVPFPPLVFPITFFLSLASFPRGASDLQREVGLGDLLGQLGHYALSALHRGHAGQGFEHFGELPVVIISHRQSHRADRLVGREQ